MTLTMSYQRVVGAVLLGAVAALSLLIGGAVLFSGSAPASPDLAANLGISTYTARRAIDLIFSFWGMAAAVALTGGWTAGILVVAKQLALRYGRAWAAAW